MEIPTYLLDVLIFNLPFVEAAETRTDAALSLLPNMDKNDRKSFLRDLDKLISKMEAKPDFEEILLEYQDVEKDPEKAKQYFQSLGVVVV